MVRIKASGYGPFFVIDCGQQDEMGESPIYEVNERGVQNGSTQASNSFGDFVLEHVNEYLKYR